MIMYLAITISIEHATSPESTPTPPLQATPTNPLQSATVLEFELRTAQETISSLRETLTSNDEEDKRKTLIQEDVVNNGNH